MLRCNDISLKAGQKHLFQLDDLNLSIGLFALVGRNGAGKSTFLNAILGLHDLEKGEIIIDDKKVVDLSTTELAKKVSLVRSKPVLFGDYKVYDILLLGRLPYQNIFAKLTNDDKSKVEEVVQFLSISDLVDRSYQMLSDGEKQLVLVARALIQDTPVILLDEPAAFLDMVNRKELMEYLKRLANEKNKLIIYSTHHVNELNQFCDGVLLINNEKMQLLSPEVDFHQKIAEAFQLI
ncbi:MAG: ABC transporter ATP-binding protein [Crocinitomicaceae bacterium]|nr:ABC transporter ATP-binding protein [Crocinitomicaceae bacterium]